MSKYISTEYDFFVKIISNIKVNGECFEYQGSRNVDGYGRVKIGGRNGKFVLAHRFIYEKMIGVIPDKILVCHTCDNPPCVNPDHLFLGTHQDNMNDMKKKGRAHRTIGERSGLCKLTTDQINDIRRDSRKQIEIANDYGVVKSTISMIKSFKSRKDG